MHKLKLRPEKKEKDRQRLIRLGKIFNKSVKYSDTIEDIFKKVRHKIIKTPTTIRSKYREVNIKKAMKINPYNYKKFTTEPSKDKLSKQFVHGLKTLTNNTNIGNKYEKSSGNQRFNLKQYIWKKENNPAYVKNEQNFRLKNAKKIPKNLNIKKTLYGYRSDRNKWLPQKILDKSANIPFVGLKK